MAEAKERDSIEAIIARQCAAWAAGDADAFAAPANDDVSFTNVMGMYTVGIEPFRAQHARIFATIYKGSRMAQKVERIAFIRDDVAVVDTLTRLEGVAHLPPGFAPGGEAPTSRLQQVLVKEDGAWRVAAFHNVFVNPAFQGPPPAT
ncbi:MAG: SgcJ/EcaC family oxidoreductase [Caulobacteraceae bacterium]